MLKYKNREKSVYQNVRKIEIQLLEPSKVRDEAMQD